MNKPLSERLDRIANAPGIATHTAYTETLLEAAALARRVEGAQERTVVQDREGFLYVGAMAAGLNFGQRVALVPVEGGS